MNPPDTNAGRTDMTDTINKIAEVTIYFWLLKIVATTLGETAGDFIAQTLKLGYVTGLAITGSILLALIAAQLVAKRYHPSLFGRPLLEQRLQARRFPI
ncbi:MAG: hypothetical protein R3D29_05920 [Nitratireductor sp.]